MDNSIKSNIADNNLNVNNENKADSQQYSENNNKTFAAMVTILGTFLAVFGGYLHALITYHYEHEKVMLFLTIGVFIVLSFLFTLSCSFGYSRRRDHMVTCQGKNDIFVKLCGDGTDKCFFTFMPDTYLIICLFLFITNIVFGLISFLAISECACNKYYCVTILFFSLSIIVMGTSWIIYYYRYLKLQRLIKEQYKNQ